MKNLFVLLLSVLLLAGCVSPEVKGTVERMAARSDNIVTKIDEEQTTRVQEQAYIRAMRAVWWSLNHDLNDADLPPDVVQLLTELGLLEEDE